MKTKFKIIIALSLAIVVVISAGSYVYLGPILIRSGNALLDGDMAVAGLSSKKHQKNKPVPPSPSTTFTENFDANYTLKEAGSVDSSSNPNWWVSSGAYLYSANGIGSTVSGPLPFADPWRVAYLISNSIDTDNGYYPQNIFRLVQKGQWKNFSQQAYFKIINDNLSSSPNRNASNGLFFFNRYQDAFNLYYVGVRVDGYAVIKKKINGDYYTMAYKPFISGPVYNNASNPILLPKNTWIGVRSDVTTNSDGTVSIKLYTDKGKTGNWVLSAEAKDDGKSYGGGSILGAGYAGIRTDFMDAQFDDYKITELK